MGNKQIATFGGGCFWCVEAVVADHGSDFFFNIGVFISPELDKQEHE